MPGGMIEPPGSFVFSRMDKCMPTETKAVLQRPTGAHRTAPSLSGSHGLSGPSVGWLVVGAGVESTCGPKIRLPTRAHPNSQPISESSAESSSQQTKYGVNFHFTQLSLKPLFQSHQYVFMKDIHSLYEQSTMDSLAENCVHGIRCFYVLLCGKRVLLNDMGL